MKVLVFAHQLEVGGTQVNAIELTAALRDRHGFDVVMFATPGPMAEVIRDKGIRYVPAPASRFCPSPARMRALRETVRRESPDLIHVWDWWQCLDAYYAVHLPMRVPMVVSDMMMNLTRILPKSIPTTFGVPELADRARAAGRRRVEVIVPPVDLTQNAPEADDGIAFRHQHGIGANEVLVVTVSRLAETLKSESLLRTVQVTGALARKVPVRFMVVGDGAVRPRLEALARNLNESAGRAAITFTGELIDPRPAYAAADVVVGMGGSALRGMAFGRPVIISGEGGFAVPLTPETADMFYYKGIYGRSSGIAGNEPLLRCVRHLAEHPRRRAELGIFARRFVERNYSLDVVSAKLARFCREAANSIAPIHSRAADAVRTATVYLRERRFFQRPFSPAHRGS